MPRMRWGAILHKARNGVIRPQVNPNRTTLQEEGRSALGLACLLERISNLPISVSFLLLNCCFLGSNILAPTPVASLLRSCSSRKRSSGRNAMVPVAALTADTTKIAVMVTIMISISPVPSTWLAAFSPASLVSSVPSRWATVVAIVVPVMMDMRCDRPMIITAVVVTVSSAFLAMEAAHGERAGAQSEQYYRNCESLFERHLGSLPTTT